MQDEDGLSFLSAVLGALGSTLTTPAGSQTPSPSSQELSGNPQTLLAGLVLAAVAKTLPSLKDNRKSWEDWILFVFAILSALAAQPGLRSLYPQLPILLLLIGVIGKTLLPIIQGGRKVEDILTAGIAIFVLLVVLPLVPSYAMLGAFCAFLTKALTTTNGQH
jgi:hypothetical protein